MTLFTNKNLRLPGLIFSALLCFTQYGVGQDLRYNFYNYDVRTGLPTEMAKCVGQDAGGYIWVGTDEGLARFDGRSFSTVSNFPGGQYIKSLLPTDKGVLVGADQGLYEINASTSFDGYRFDTLMHESTHSLEYPKQAFELSDGSRFVAFRNGIARYDAGSWSEISFPSEYRSDNFVRSFQVFENGLGRVYAMSVQGQLFALEENSAHPIGLQMELPFHEVSSSTLVSEGEVWVGTESGVFALHFDQDQHIESVSRIGYVDGISDLEKLNNDFVLIGTWSSGLYVADLVRNNYVSRIENYEASNVNDILIDKDGDVWLASDRGLVLGVEPPFETINLGHGGADGYASGLAMGRTGSVSAVVGNHIYNVRSVTSTNSSIVQTPFNSSYLLSVAGDETILWASTSTGELYRFNHGQLDYTTIPFKANHSIFYIHLDGYQNLWMCAQDQAGVTRVDRDLSVETVGVDLMGEGNPSAIASVTDDILWVAKGDRGGIYRVNVLTNEVEDISPQLPAELDSGLVIHDMVVDKEGTGWLGTSMGLVKFNGVEITGHWRFTEDHVSPLVKAVTMDNTGIIWLADQDGVVGFDPSTEFSARYDLQSGLPSTTISYRGIRANRGGEVWVATSNGLGLINNAEYRIKSTAGPDIRSVIIDGDLVHINDLQNISINPTSYVKVALSVPAFPGDHVGFRYRVAGKSNKWIYTKDPSIVYGRLSSGLSTVEIQACKTGGFHWSDSTTLELVVDDHWFMKKWVWALFAVTMVVLIVLIVRINTWRLKHETARLNAMVAERTEEVERQKEELLDKNKQIESSLRYAETIQEALLPSLEELQWVLPGTFVLYKPRDIVSGDFYWYAQLKSKILLVAADCTGHGVPGALMSMIGAQLLNNIVHSQEIERPDEILEELHHGIHKELRQSAKRGNRDGMDIAIVAIDKEHQRLEFAGAKNPMVIVRNGEVTMYKGHFHSIGGDAVAPAGEKMFPLEVVSYQTGDQLFLYSDGYQDQFGGPKDAKLKVGPFKKLLAEAAKMEPSEQHQFLNSYINRWIRDGMSGQTDDILVMGVKL